MFFTVITHMKNGVIMSFKNKLFKEMLKNVLSSNSESQQIFSTFAAVDPTQPNPTQPTGQPNPWTTLSCLQIRRACQTALRVQRLVGLHDGG